MRRGREVGVGTLNRLASKTRAEIAVESLQSQFLTLLNDFACECDDLAVCLRFAAVRVLACSL